MIHNVLNYLSEQLDHFLKHRFSVQDPKAILGNILNEAGIAPPENKNKIILSLINIEQETTRMYAAPQRSTAGGVIAQNQPYNFNIDILVTASFANYNEALKYLSETIYFFYTKQVFTSENSPGLDPGLQKITMELIKIDYSDMQNLWSALGTHHQPSALFKVRMLAFQNEEITDRPPTVTTRLIND